jgi:hypothetical protein
VEERRSAQRFLVGDLMEKDHSEYLRHRWEDNIKIDRQEVDLVHELKLSGSGWGQIAGSCERGNKLSSSIKCGEYEYLD